jgi:hypothetical protein
MGGSPKIIAYVLAAERVRWIWLRPRDHRPGHHDPIGSWEGLVIGNRNSSDVNALGNVGSAAR